MAQLALAQKEDHQWIFNAFSVGIDSSPYPEVTGASLLDFNYDPPRYYRDSIATMDIHWTHASICDEEGQLLLYSNGMRISKGIGDHRPLPGAQRISYGPRWELRTWEDEFGIEQPYGFSFPSSTIFIPHPRNDSDIIHIYVNYDDVESGYISKLFAEIGYNNAGELLTLRKDALINDKISTPCVT